MVLEAHSHSILGDVEVQSTDLVRNTLQRIVESFSLPGHYVLRVFPLDPMRQIADFIPPSHTIGMHLHEGDCLLLIQTHTTGYS